MERTSMTGRRHAATEREILAAAARLLGSGDAVGMGKIAAAAGIARATLYRYFPTRESLLQALEAGANEEARRGLDEANLDQVPVEEGLARAIRALVAVGENFIVLLRERRSAPDPRRLAPRSRCGVRPRGTQSRDGIGGHELHGTPIVSSGRSRGRRSRLISGSSWAPIFERRVYINWRSQGADLARKLGNESVRLTGAGRRPSRSALGQRASVRSPSASGLARSPQ